MSKDNIINFDDLKGQPTEPPEPTHYMYETMLMMPDGTTTSVKTEGYLIVTGAFVGVCQGPYSKSEFRFVAPLERVVYSNCLGPVKYAGTLNS